MGGIQITINIFEVSNLKVDIILKPKDTEARS